MSCLGAGRAPCAWEARYHEAQDALLLARYEARKWKEKHAQEKQRRRRLARSLLDTMALVEESRRAASSVTSPSYAKRTRRSSSTFSDMDQIDSLLSPTLSSFDFDDDDEEEDNDEELDEEGEGDGERGDGDTHTEVDVTTRRVSTAVEDGSAVASSAALSSATPLGTSNGHVSSNSNSDGRTRVSVARATSQRDVRPARSSTIGGTFDAVRRGSVRRDGNVTLPPSNLLYRMLYAKPSSQDLWSSQTSKFHSVARSVMFSMQLKKEHVFEHFFMVGFWKPKVFYEFAQRSGRPPDPTIADFCFPVGVPVVKCKPHQASSLVGSPISIWTTDAEKLQKHTLDPFRSSGYTFRLTGAKGEVLYGMCVSIMSELIVKDDADATHPPISPRSERAKRASCPNGSALRLSEPLHESYGSSYASKRDGGGETKSRDPPSSTTYLAPICYCFTSKFPFYKLHFALLRLIIESDLQARQPSSNSGRPSDLYDITLTVESELGVEFAVCRQPNVTSLPTTRDAGGGNSTSSMGSLSSVSSGIHRDRMGDATLSEEAPMSLSSPPSQPSEIMTGGRSCRRSSGLKKSFSSDDIASYKSSNACVVEKPVVVRMNGAVSPRVAAQVQVGDVLEAIDGVSTASLQFAEALELVKNAPRPLKLRFHRLKSREFHDTYPRSPVLKRTNASASTVLAPASSDILQRARRLPIGDPGQWTTLRLPDYAVNYQFPKRDAERWSIGVLLRFLAPNNIVKILAHLLLEKQVVVMGASSSQVSATCTALLLLLAPFQWQSTYIPQLPSSLVDFLHSPVPFLVGCQPLQSTDEWPDVCFFDIDADVILTPIADHHINAKSIPHGDELTRLFQGASQRYHRLRATSKPWHELSDDEDKIITLTMQESQIFLKDICSELTSMQFTPTEGRSFYERLQEEVATIVRKSNFEDFLEEFSQTQLFCQYCEATFSADHSGNAVYPTR